MIEKMKYIEGASDDEIEYKAQLIRNKEDALFKRYE